MPLRAALTFMLSVAFTAACAAQSVAPAYQERAAALADESDWSFEPNEPRAAPVTYRTLCVRTCDGFYFPISFRTTRENLAEDASRCAARCRGGQLFFHPNPGGDVASARNFAGLQYEALPTAFRHLKQMVQGCSCRPDPWSEEERKRHAGYAAAQRRQLERQPEPPTGAPRAEERALALRRRAPPSAPKLTAVAPPRRTAASGLPLAAGTREHGPSGVLRILNRAHSDAGQGTARTE